MSLGRRPSPSLPAILIGAEQIYDVFVERFRERGIPTRQAAGELRWREI